MNLRKVSLAVTAFALLLAGAGCGIDLAQILPPESPPSAAAVVDAPPQPVEQLTIHAAPTADDPSPSSAEVSEPSSSLKLREAFALAIAKSPQLTTFSWDVRAADARRLQAELRPNPELSLAVEDFLGTGEYGEGRQAQTTLRLSQLIELGGKRDARMDVAANFLSRAEADYRVKSVAVLSDVTEKFIQAVAAQEELELAGNLVKQSEDSLQAARRRVQAGRASPMEESKAQVELSRSRITREHAVHELLVAKRRLAATWGNTTPRFSSVSGSLFARKAIPTFEQLAERVVSSPEIARWATEEKLREAEVRLALAKRVPDFEVQGGFRRLEGPREQGLVMQLSMPLPFFHRNQGDIAESRALLQKSSNERAASEVELRTLLFALYQELQHAVTELDVLEKSILPESNRSLALAREGFELGKFTQLELTDAIRMFIQVREQFIDAAKRYHQRALEIERLTGVPFDDTTAGTTGPENDLR